MNSFSKCFYEKSKNKIVEPGIKIEFLKSSVKDQMIKSKCTMDSLSNEILVRITQLLNKHNLMNVSLVSKRWYRLCNDGLNWKKISFTNKQYRLRTIVINSIMYKCSNFLTHLEFYDCTFLANQQIIRLVDRSKNIQILNLSGCSNLTDDAFESITCHTSKLRELYIKSLQKITDLTLFYFGQNCKHLNVLDISCCRQLTSHGISQLLKGCKNISDFNCSYCEMLTDDAIENLVTESPLLTTININYCCNLTDEALKSIGRSCKNINTLYISGSKIYTDIGLIHLSKKLNYLRNFEACNCSEFTDTGLMEIFKKSKYLENVDIENCRNISDLCLLVLSINTKVLRNVILSNCVNITDDGICGIISTNYKTLTSLDIENCKKITDKSLELLAECPKLRRIALYDCELITEKAIAQINLKNPTVIILAFYENFAKSFEESTNIKSRVTCCTIS
ncbi:hypothetical protein A3Q56_01903 [Intoshia linei]|uniref:F-box domain-containing protein n=1 Tax=Intoshia linei TaxID=1819745 RepID=A0A177B7V4_9BILA|nr:hypothetical protein A3Q56_01903 [Intoshia linei]